MMLKERKINYKQQKRGKQIKNNTLKRQTGEALGRQVKFFSPSFVMNIINTK